MIQTTATGLMLLQQLPALDLVLPVRAMSPDECLGQLQRLRLVLVLPPDKPMYVHNVMLRPGTLLERCTGNVRTGKAYLCVTQVIPNTGILACGFYGGGFLPPRPIVDYRTNLYTLHEVFNPKIKPQHRLWRILEA